MCPRPAGLRQLKPQSTASHAFASASSRNERTSLPRFAAAISVRRSASVGSRPHVQVPSCLVLDLTLPDLNGLDVQHRVADRTDMPIIFISGHFDVTTTSSSAATST